MARYNGISRDLHVIEGVYGRLGFSISEAEGAFSTRDVQLHENELKRLRDQIDDRIGPKETHPPVGTIVCGTGLTEAQKRAVRRIDTKRLSEARGILNSAFNWSDTAEDSSFWRAINLRLVDIIQSAEAEMSKPDKVGAVEITSHTTVGVALTNRSPYGTSRTAAADMTAAEARELAAVLTKHADRVESKS